MESYDLMSHHFPPGFSFHPSDEERITQIGDTILHVVACRYKSYMVSSIYATLHTQNLHALANTPFGNTPLHLAAMSGHRSLFNSLLDSNLHDFTFMEIREATKNFIRSSDMGNGNIGTTYKGFIDGKQGHWKRLAEVIFLGHLKHPNLVKLMGYCLEDKSKLLVYEYMERGNFEYKPFKGNSSALPWSTRVKIAIGLTKGLAYLHEERQPVIYRDFKASNILLSSFKISMDYNAKLSDFGLRKDGLNGMKTRVFNDYFLVHEAMDVAESIPIYGLMPGLCAYVISAISFTVLRVCALRKKLIYGHIYGFIRMLLRSSSPETKESNKTSSKVNGRKETWNVPQKGSDNMNSKENIMQKVSSWITVLTFPGCLLLTNYKHYSSLCNDQMAFLSIWIALLGMLNFTVFFPSLILMAVSGAHFTSQQITLLLISAMLITMKAYVPLLGFIYSHV